MNTLEILALLKAYAPETAYGFPYAEAHLTDGKKEEHLIQLLRKEFSVPRVRLIGPLEEATLMSRIAVVVDDNALKEYLSGNPLGSIMVMVSIIGDFAVYGEDAAVPVEMKMRVAELIKEAGLILVPATIVMSESCYPGRTWSELYFGHF